MSWESLTSIRNGGLDLGVRVGVEQPTEGNYYQNGAIHFERRLLADSGARGAGSFLFIVVILVAVAVVVLACVTYATRKYFHCFARVAHSLALVVLKSLLVVSCVQTEEKSVMRGLQWCAKSVSFCSALSFHYTRIPLQLVAGRGRVPLLLPLYNLHFYFCALESVTVLLCIALRIWLSRTTN